MPQDTPPTFPYQDGDITVLGPEIFASQDGQVISWKGDNYTRQTCPAPDGPALTYVGAPHEGTATAFRVDMRAPDDARERAICRALLHHALALLDASEPTRPYAVSAERL